MQRLFSFLNRLQNQPEEHRLVVALGTAGVVTLFIATVWFSNLSFGIAVPEQVVAGVAAVPSPFETIQEQINQVGSVFSDSFSQ